VPATQRRVKAATLLSRTRTDRSCNAAQFRLSRKVRGDGAVAEHAHRDRLGFQHLQALRSADRDRDAAGDNAVGAQHADREVGDMHRAALAAAIAALAPVELEHHAGRIGALGDGVAVAAVIGGEPVVLAQAGADAGGDTFLPERDVQRTRDLACLVGGKRRLLEGADPHHRAIEVDEALEVVARRRWLRPACHAFRTHPIWSPSGALPLEEGACC
jgi:hypothetical protein